MYGKVEEAQDQLAAEALKCMEGSYSKVLQDKNYDKAQPAQQKCQALEYQQKEKTE